MHFLPRWLKRQSFSWWVSSMEPALACRRCAVMATNSTNNTTIIIIINAISTSYYLSDVWWRRRRRLDARRRRTSDSFGACLRCRRSAFLTHGRIRRHSGPLGATRVRSGGRHSARRHSARLGFRGSPRLGATRVRSGRRGLRRVRVFVVFPALSSSSSSLLFSGVKM